MLEKQISQVEYRSGSQVVCHVPELGETQTWRMFDSLLSKALTSADGAGCSWSFKTRWGNDKKIRLQMADITQRFFSEAAWWEEAGDNSDEKTALSG